MLTLKRRLPFSKFYKYLEYILIIELTYLIIEELTESSYFGTSLCTVFMLRLSVEQHLDAGHFPISVQ